MPKQFSKWHTPDDEVSESRLRKYVGDDAQQIEWNLEVRSVNVGCGTRRMGELRIHGDLTGRLTVAIIDEITVE